MKRLLQITGSCAAILAVSMIPLVTVSAAGSTFNVCTGADCNLGSLLQLGSNVIDFIIMISVPISAVMFAYGGFLMVSAAGSESQIEKAKSIFWKVGIGFFFVLSAWLIVKLIVGALLDPSYIFLK